MSDLARWVISRASSRLTRGGPRLKEEGAEFVRSLTPCHIAALRSDSLAIQNMSSNSTKDVKTPVWRESLELDLGLDNPIQQMSEQRCISSQLPTDNWTLGQTLLQIMCDTRSSQNSLTSIAITALQMK